ncbi:MAG: hypothetical protein JST85_10955 [Acidobacteria bacterium]|nr:hypothetical protein [Acidobacteriota bacterium]
MPNSEAELSILITVVSGKEALRRCLSMLRPQLQSVAAEVVVPYDDWSLDVCELKAEFPEVKFYRIARSVAATVPSHQHRLYDLRRAVGLAQTTAKLIAMTEDHAVPATDWVSRILAAHQQSFGVVGGAIENGIDHPMNWALYYCDFGRYGSPLPTGEVEYVSDVNVSYKRQALEAVRDVWRNEYHETTVHWTMKQRGIELRLDPALKVYQHRPPMTFTRAFRERIEWGRVFAETRVAAIGFPRRMVYALITPFLPAVLLARIAKHMHRQSRSLGQMAVTLPLVAGLLVGWAWGEFLGYVSGAPNLKPDWQMTAANSQPLE